MLLFQHLWTDSRWRRQRRWLWLLLGRCDHGLTMHRPSTSHNWPPTIIWHPEIELELRVLLACLTAGFKKSMFVHVPFSALLAAGTECKSGVLCAGTYLVDGVIDVHVHSAVCPSRPSMLRVSNAIGICLSCAIQISFSRGCEQQMLSVHMQTRALSLSLYIAGELRLKHTF